MADRDEEEWRPEEGEGEGEEEDEEENEGVSEGVDSVTVAAATENDDDMDTIARSVSHPYYLRSLHTPDAHSGTNPPHQTILQVPRLPSKVGRAVVSKPHPLPLVTTENQERGLVVCSCYTPTPRPNLPPPPMPRGTSAGDYYQSLDARDEEIRKSE